MDLGLQERVKFAKRVIEEQSSVFKELFGKVESRWKHDGSRVTDADLRLSKAFREQLLGKFSDDQFLSEEGDVEDDPVSVKPGFAWLIDPVDGTNNFARGVSCCGISLALLKDGDPVYGYIYDHASDSLFHGGPGFGVYQDSHAVTLSNETPGEQSIVSAQTANTEESCRDVTALQARFKVRSLGASALHIAYVVAGLTDGVVEHTIKPWDIAAGCAMLKELGGKIYFFDKPIFPMKWFSVAGDGFGFLAGSEAMCQAMSEVTGRTAILERTRA